MAKLQKKPKLVAIESSPIRLSWEYIRHKALQHQGTLVKAHVIAVLAALTSVPIPLLMPLLVDEVLLQHPGRSMRFFDSLTPPAWHIPLFYIAAILGLALLLRVVSIALSVWQTRQFALISKDVTYHVRCALIRRLERI
jgi:ATP-binding cassette subfamily C protein